ncbi:hypothetical protein CL634_07975, partial [bacterium]|nr:hypothetical protein [bacterium]
LDELRKDIKTDQFEVVYFLDTDRVARDVTYQNLIISEILKYGKQIVIKGKDYVQNPENKFTLTVLGAVNELEKAKIVERFMRGRREKARQNQIMSGTNIFGYNYIKKTDKKPGYFIVNEKESDVVRLMFETYANTNLSITGLIKFLEEQGCKTKNNSLRWGRSSIKRILSNTAYYGVQHFNKTERIESTDKAGRYAKNIKTKVRHRDKKEWIAVEVPSLIAKDLYDVVQEKLKRNYKMTRNSGRKYLLSTLVKCGVCNHTYTGYTQAQWESKYYRCNFRQKGKEHSPDVELNYFKCNNKQVSARKIEEVIWSAVTEKVLQPKVIKNHIDILKSKKDETKKSFSNKIESLNTKIELLEGKKKRILDLYADSVIDKDNYVSKIGEIDLEIKQANGKRDELINTLSSLNNRSEVRKNIYDFCTLARKRLEKMDFDKKKLFLKQLIDEIVINHNKLIIRGFIPVLADNQGMPSKYRSRHTISMMLITTDQSSF